MTWNGNWARTTANSAFRLGNFNLNSFIDRVEIVDVDRPRRIGYGPPTASSCLDLQPFPTVIWDTNGYYSDLGVDPRATREELRRAYQRKKGWRSVRLTYVLKQLLNPEIRRLYDLTPCGACLRDDVWAAYEHRLIKLAVAERMRMYAAHGIVPEDLEAFEVDVFREMKAEGDPLFDGVRLKSDRAAEDLEQVLDAEDLARQDGTPPWIFSYYLWGDIVDPDTSNLPEWQRAIIESLARAGEVVQFAVGLHGDVDVPYKVDQVGNLIVAFLRHDELPTKQLAELAACRVMTIISTPEGEPHA